MKKKIWSAVKADVATIILVLPMLFFENSSLQSTILIVGAALAIPWLNLLLDKYFVWWVLQYVVLTVLTFLPEGGHILLIYWGSSTVVLLIAGLLDTYEYSQK